MKTAEFEVTVTEADATRFAELSGDWNPLHTDASYAAQTSYRRPILHGAFSAGLMSRMAGMHLPGRACLLHAMRLKFTGPIQPPARLVVRGQLVRESAEAGQVEVMISDAASGARCVEGSYEFGYHETRAAAADAAPVASRAPGDGEPVVLVTGASGGLGGAVLRRLGDRAVAVGRDLALDRVLAERSIAAIVHCGWPPPDNGRLTALGGATAAAVAHHVAAPLADVIALATALSVRGAPNAALILVGSTFAEPGRHNYRMPLYSLGKALVPTLVRILAVELGAPGRRCIGVEFDVLDGGMNAGMKPSVRLAHADRSPFGTLTTPDEAADQIAWVLGNAASMVSGAMIRLTGGSIP